MGMEFETCGTTIFRRRSESVEEDSAPCYTKAFTETTYVGERQDFDNRHRICPIFEQFF